MSDSRGAANGKSELEREADIQQAIESIDATQNALDGLNDQASEEILKIESKYNKQRDPLCRKRAEAISKIPGFWHRVLTNHPQIVSYITDEEDECLQYLVNVEVCENEDIKTGYKLTFTFDVTSNPFFTNETIEKSMMVEDGGKTKSSCSKIDWKSGKNLVDGKKEAAAAQLGQETTFFGWLAGGSSCGSSAKNGGTEEDGTGPNDESMDEMGDDIGEYIKDDIWPNPLNYFLAHEMEDDEDDEDGVGAGGDGGEYDDEEEEEEGGN